MNFKKGDILEGDKGEFDEAYHPVVYIDGPDEAPIAVVLTHGGPDRYPCNTLKMAVLNIIIMTLEKGQKEIHLNSKNNVTGKQNKQVPSLEGSPNTQKSASWRSFYPSSQ